MKIGVLMTIPGGAGTQQAAALTAEALAIAGLDVTLILPKGKNSVLSEYCCSAKITSISPYFPALSPIRYLKNPLLALKLRKQFSVCVSELKQHLSLGEFDLLLALHPTAFQVARSATNGRIPIAAMLTRIYGSQVRQMRTADAFIVTTEEMQAFAINYGVHKERCHLLPHCVIDPRPVHRTGIRHPVRLGAMARLEPEKGVATLLEALAILRTRGIDFSATIAGKGKQRDRLVSMNRKLGLERHVHFPGWLDGAAKEDFFKSIDILIHPARIEAFGIIILEGMARGLPIISGNTVGARHIITNDVDGVIFDPHDPTLLANCVERLVRNQEQALELGRSARATFERRFKLEAIGHEAARILITVATNS